MMPIEEILYRFNHCEGYFPTEALIAALAQQRELIPHLLMRLEQVISQPEQVQNDQMDYIFALYLLSKFRETKAYPLILSLAALPGETPEDLLGDCITEALARFIVSTFNGDITAIKHLIENENANMWSRNAGFKSLVGLVALNQLQREELIEYLRALFYSPLSNSEEFVTELISTAVDLYPEELLPEIDQAFEAGKVDTWVVNKKWIERVLAQGKAQCLLDYVYKDHFHLPIDDVEEAMGWMQGFHQHRHTAGRNNFEEEYEDNFNDGRDFYLEPVTTYTRETPKVGRNEPCPCGSGKKFKKCCLE